MQNVGGREVTSRDIIIASHEHAKHSITAVIGQHAPSPLISRITTLWSAMLHISGLPMLAQPWRITQLVITQHVSHARSSPLCSCARMYSAKDGQISRCCMRPYQHVQRSVWRGCPFFARPLHHADKQLMPAELHWLVEGLQERVWACLHACALNACNMAQHKQDMSTGSAVLFVGKYIVLATFWSWSAPSQVFSQLRMECCRQQIPRASCNDDFVLPRLLHFFMTAFVL